MTDIFTSQTPLVLLVASLFGYLLGSIPFGLVITKFAGLGDVRNIGSGNIGATNVLRTGNKKVAAGVLLADLLKGTIAVVVAQNFGLGAGMLAGLCAFLGHLFPIWLKFKGGKGVATYIGVLLGLAPIAVLVFAIVWLSVAFIFRFSSLAALCALTIVPIALYLLGHTNIAILFGVMSVIAIAKHHENIGRLLSGTESKIGGKKT
jgi:glycerol-3-phosphate acyltransferase PlsY